MLWMYVTPNDSELFYDCKTTGGSYHCDHIIEVAATVVVPDGSHITSTQFFSLCHTSRHIALNGNKYLYSTNAPFLFYQCRKSVG